MGEAGFGRHAACDIRGGGDEGAGSSGSDGMIGVSVGHIENPVNDIGYRRGYRMYSIDGTFWLSVNIQL
jgi:hypothetical protein